MQPQKIISSDGDVIYFGRILPESSLGLYFNQLREKAQWKAEEITIFGKHLILNRKVAWYGDAPFSYSYSHSTKLALPWFRELTDLRHQCEEITRLSFNSCLLNLYPTGNDGMGWHSDDEISLQTPNHIASLSLGAQRIFQFKHKITGEKISLLLNPGDLLLMKHPNQSHWLHSVPKSKKVIEPRINLTFRNMNG
jgi:alkylated DNA repair dioxygenase AlkB